MNCRKNILNHSRILLVTLVSLLILISSSITHPAYALQLIGTNWSSDKYYQGDGGTITLKAYNDVPLVEWYIKTITIQFDWQVQSQYSFQTPVGQYIASGQSSTFSTPFEIPQTASIGTHSYTIYYVGIGGDPLDRHSIATSFFTVHDMYEKQYDGMLSSIQSKINSAPNYNSPDASSSLNQAKSDFVQATTLATNNQFQSATSKLNDAQNLLNQADQQERSYNSNNANNYNSGGGSSNNNYYPNSNNSYSSFDPTLLFIIAIPVAVAIGVVILVIMKKRNARSTPKKSKKSIPTSMSETKSSDISSMPNTEPKAAEVKNEVIVEDIPKIEAKPKQVKPKKSVEKRLVKNKTEIEQDQKALGILKERLATGAISKSEYDELKKEFE